jgi:hypothetical protein
MKKIFKLLTVSIITLLTISCSSEKENTEILHQNKGVLKFENKTYVFKEDGLTSRYLDGKKEFDFKYENLDKGEGELVVKKSLTNKSGEDEETILFENNATSEYIVLSNLNVLADNKMSFDATTSNGIILKDIVFESNDLNLTTTNSSIQNKVCWQCATIIVGVLVDGIVDLASDSYNSNCNAAINACGSGGVQSITIIDQGWFSPASCTVICN